MLFDRENTRLQVTSIQSKKQYQCNDNESEANARRVTKQKRECGEDASQRQRGDRQASKE